MHVGFLVTEYPPVRCGGIGTSVRNLAREYVRLGHEVSVVLWDDRGEFEDEGVRVRSIGRPPLPKTGWLTNRLRSARAVNRLVRREGLELLETHDWCGPSAGVRADCPIVVRCHGTDTYFADLLGERVRPRVRLAERTALRAARSVAACSAFTAERTRALFGLEAPVRVIFNGVDPAELPEPSAARPGSATVLNFGTLVRKKGVLDLCRAFARIAVRDPRAELVLAGRDAHDKRSGAASTWALCREVLGGPALQRTHYAGSLPFADLRARIRDAALCVFPTYAEAFPMSWLEAMGSGRCVVAYDIGWARELIEDGVHGRLVPAGDVDALAETVLELLAHPGRRAELGRAARARIERRFTLRQAAEESLRWYGEAAG